jgi:hypothetical protein
MPSAHDKVHEAHYFIHQLIENYHYPHPFRYYLSAFLSAARSITWMLQKELAGRDGFRVWYGPRQERMKADDDLAFLNSLRVGAVHQASLVPKSTAWVGFCKYGEPRLGYGGLQNPMNGSLHLLLLARRHMSNYVHPHRAWIGEELGLLRKWALVERPDMGLVAFCITAWEKLATVVAEAHQWCGANYEPSATCRHDAERCGLLRESEVFSEVASAWEGDPTHEVSLRHDRLDLLAGPWEGADPLHIVKSPATVRGWVGQPTGWWPPEYGSMLVHSIEGTEISENTGVFFDLRRATVATLPRSADEV